MLSRQEEERERRETLQNDRRVREQTGTYLSHTHNEAGGRFAREQTVVGKSSDPWPKLPASSPWSGAQPSPGAERGFGKQLSKLSFEAMVGGIDKYMQEYFDFPKFCDQVGAAFKLRRFISKRDLNREFFRRMRQGFELDRVIQQLIKQGLIEFARQAPPTGGHTAEGWRWIGD